MAIIFNKVSHAGSVDVDISTLVLGNREALIYPLPFANWKQIKVGMLYSFADNSNVNSTTYIPGTPYSTLYVSNKNDRFWFGLKSSSTLSFPGENDEYFWGARTNLSDVSVYNQIRDVVNDAYINRVEIGTVDPTYNSIIIGAFYMRFSRLSYHTTTQRFASFIEFEMALIPKSYGGYVKSRINTFDSTNYELLADPTLSYFNTKMSSTSLGSFGSDVLVQPRDPPCNLFLSWPFYDSRIRVHAIGAIKIS